MNDHLVDVPQEAAGLLAELTLTFTPTTYKTASKQVVRYDSDKPQQDQQHSTNWRCHNTTAISLRGRLQPCLQAGGQSYLPHGGVQGSKEGVLGQHGRGGERIHKAALASIGVSHQSYQWDRQLCTAPPVLLPTLLHLFAVLTKIFIVSCSRQDRQGASGKDNNTADGVD